MKRKIILFLFLTAISKLSLAQDIDKKKLDAYFSALDVNNKFLGSVALSRNGEVIYTKTIGPIDIENKLAGNANSKYRIGSISKTFTAVLALQAIEKGLLNLNQTIQSYFPGIKNAEKITISNLLYHRSGIPNFTNDKDYLKWNTVSKSENELLELFSKSGSDFDPDTRSEYSNSNYVLLTFILEKAFKKPYAALLTEYITKPLGLKNTYLGGKINSSNNESHSYKFAGKWQREPETDISIPLGAGGIVSTPADLTKFSYSLFNGKLLNPHSLEQMKTIKDMYGMGLVKLPFSDKTGYGHTGGIDGFNSIFGHFPDGNISFAVISNGTNFSTNNVAIALLSTVYNKNYDLPSFKNIEVSPEELEKYLGVYASSQIPLKITITKDNKTLFAQASGQSSFPLEASQKDEFRFDAAGIRLEFNPSEKTMILNQGGGRFFFKKE